MFQKFRPLNNNVWVQKVEEESRTAAGLYIPDSAKQDAQVGIVLATAAQNGIKVGDKVFFNKYAGTKAGESSLVLKQEDILGIIED